MGLQGLGQFAWLVIGTLALVLSCALGAAAWVTALRPPKSVATEFFIGGTLYRKVDTGFAKVLSVGSYVIAAVLTLVTLLMIFFVLLAAFTGGLPSA